MNFFLIFVISKFRFAKVLLFSDNFFLNLILSLRSLALFKYKLIDFGSDTRPVLNLMIFLLAKFDKGIDARTGKEFK